MSEFVFFCSCEQHDDTGKKCSAPECIDLMKVLHVNQSDIFGGAARAAYRIHSGLQKLDVESQMLVIDKRSEDESVLTYPLRFNKRKRKLAAKITRLQGSVNPTLHSINIFPSAIHNVINSSNADIVHLHWINSEMISIAEVAKIKKPMVWTLHDMWAFCGAEHYDDLDSPGRYMEEYFASNKRKTHQGRIDIDRWTWRRKKKHWQPNMFHFVAPSRWLADCLHNSALFRGRDARVIPNGLDIEKFFPVEKKNARQKLQLPENKKIILFGSSSPKGNPLKGHQLFEDAVKKYVRQMYPGNDYQQDCELVIFGLKKTAYEFQLGMPVRYMGWIEDDAKLALLYAAADIMVNPSKIESFGQTASEAMACGTPVVCFKTSGLSDIVDHKKNGFLAEPFDTEQLALGIGWVIEDEERRRVLGAAARRKVEVCFESTRVVRQYRSFYDDVLSMHS